MLLAQMTRKDKAKGEKTNKIEPPVINDNTSSYIKQSGKIPLDKLRYTGVPDFGKTQNSSDKKPYLSIDINKVN